ncbi:MAG: PIN domain-containing protein [Bacteroidetes bacterium]|nr:PIN domain-containing protein [Bacteroidota bacterium]MCH8525489.1 PIN domain-containing protein [Balneolales bacterium]
MMVAEHKILLDSCVLANFAVCDLFLRLAEKPRLILPRWSKKILIEVRRTHTEKLGWTDSIADSFQNALQDNFPEAEVQDYDNLIPVMQNHEKDRHVLAAAVRDQIDTIITFNLKDFKPVHLEHWRVIAIHPQDYLITLLELNKGVVFARLTDIAINRKQDLETTVIDFGKSLPKFANALLEDIG